MAATPKGFHACRRPRRLGGGKGGESREPKPPKGGKGVPAVVLGPPPSSIAAPPRAVLPPPPASAERPRFVPDPVFVGCSTVKNAGKPTISPGHSSWRHW